MGLTPTARREPIPAIHPTALHTMSKLQFPSDDELDLVVIAIQALLPHKPDPKFHDLHAINQGREILRNCLNRWEEPMTEDANIKEAMRINDLSKNPFMA